MEGDEQAAPEIEALHFEQAVVHSVKTWPARTSLTEESLRYAHTMSARVEEDGNLVIFDLFNGEATYRRVPGEVSPFGHPVFDLVEGSDKVTTRKVQRS